MLSKLSFVAMLIAGGLSSCAPARAQDGDIDADAFMAFQDICLRDKNQFEYAKEAAGDMLTAPAQMKAALLNGREGEIWISSARPLIALSVQTDGGCGIYMKPVREDYLDGFLGAIPGQDIVHTQSVESAWGRWYLVHNDGLKGVLSAWFLDINGEKSIDLRYTPSSIVLNQDWTIDYLRLEPHVFEKVRASLMSK